MLSITSDYFQSAGDALPYLQRIAEAGFTHVHWCHEWATDYIEHGWVKVSCLTHSLHSRT